MVSPGNIFLGYVFYQYLFNFVGGVVLGRHQPQAVADAEYMGIDSHCRLAESDTLNDIGSLTSHTRKVE